MRKGEPVTKRFLLCGASGVVGQALVPLLRKQGVEVRLVGRDVQRLAQLYPGCDVGSYDEISDLAAGCSLVVNLAARNNDQAGTQADFQTANVDHALEVMDLAKQAQVDRFVNFSSLHAATPEKSLYAASKARADEELTRSGGGFALSIRLAAIHGIAQQGKLRLLARLPRFLQFPLFALASALRPTVSVGTVAHFLATDAATWPDTVTELSDGQHSNLLFLAVKRTIDLVFALAVAILFFWLFAILWLAVRIDSPGPAIFAQTRVGRAGQAFVCYKFRTMAQGTTQRGTHEVGASSITRVGGFLRKSKLDELPQVLNILKNELSLVGPRPCLPVQSELIAERSRRGVLNVKPGITGLAQVHEIDMSTPKLLAQWDRRYVMQRSILSEISVVFATFLGRGQGDRIGS
ncbi:hybrid nucleoside-diphosphate sugar epimerase/sugar transferase [Parerythrobacter jejuensis]|uniref:hybrid nucleoside-diphosphate sugar epimerase/sugar transferase n=1 Tax=Parerythrobacter jejuensis TaxID=795812 RepID=UPI00136E8EDD|nr:hybrid nucleoside-diphosphate sugar epimerase/sugar transferase [Parerythrobacter jejuensis]